MKAQLTKAIVAWLFIFSSTSAISQVKTDVLERKYNLIREHSIDTQYFIMESRLTRFNPNGTRMEPDIYRLYLRCIPGRPGADEYTCLKFTVKSGQSPEVSVPSLANWKYTFTRRSDEKDEKEQLFGIDHSRFEKLKDENGNSIFIDKSYHIYNAFIDFHSMNVFADKSPKGKGVQDLSRIGDTVVHYASWSEPPVNLGSQVEKGSVFKNGKITLAFKGLSLVNGKSCAVIEYDSGESSFTMLMKPTPDIGIKTTGTSHYWGDIFKALETGWIQKATLHEIVVSETAVPGQSNKTNATIERSIIIQNVHSIKF
jgi:hypothetical protein